MCQMCSLNLHALYYHQYRVQKAKLEFEAVQADLFALVTNSETDALRLNNLLMEFPKLQVRRLSLKTRPDTRLP